MTYTDETHEVWPRPDMTLPYVTYEAPYFEVHYPTITRTYWTAMTALQVAARHIGYSRMACRK